MRKRRICSRCGQQIRRRHHWHLVKRRFLFWTVKRPEHYNCASPEYYDNERWPAIEEPNDPDAILGHGV